MSSGEICTRCKTHYPQGRPKAGACLNCGNREFRKGQQADTDIGLDMRRHRSSDFYDPGELQGRLNAPPPPPPSGAQPSTGKFLRTEYEGARGVQAPRQAPRPRNPLRGSSSEEHQAVSGPAPRPQRANLQNLYESSETISRPKPGHSDYMAAVANVQPRPVDTFSAITAEAQAYQQNLGHDAIPSDTLTNVQHSATSPLVWSPGSTTQSEVIADRFLIRNTRNDLLGTGAKGVVYKAYDTNLGGRKVAVKLFFDAFGDLNDPELIEEEKNRTQREVEIQGELAHPGIVTIYDRFESEHGAGVVLEFVDGETLEERIDRLRILPAGDAVRFTIELAKAVEFMHQLGFIHRDMKPGNVLITRDENAKLIDFGLSKQKNGKDPFDNSVTRQLKLSDTSVYKTQEGDIVGTPAYMAPEQAAGRLSDVDETSDIYGLGAILFHCLTGQPPVNKDTIEEVLDLVIEGKIDSPREVNSTIDPALEAIVLKALALERTDRFESALKLREQLVCYQDGQQLDSSVYKEPLSTRLGRWLYKYQTFFYVVFTVFLSLGVVFGGYQYFLKQQIEGEQDSQLKDIKVDAVRGDFVSAQQKLSKFQEKVQNHPDILPLLTELKDARQLNRLINTTRQNLKAAKGLLVAGEKDKAENKYSIAESSLKEVKNHVETWRNTKAEKDNRLYKLIQINSLYDDEWYRQSLRLAQGLTSFSLATPQSTDAIAVTATLELRFFNERLELSDKLFEFQGPNGKQKNLLIPIVDYRLPLGLYQAQIRYQKRVHRFPLKIERGKDGLMPVVIGQIPEPPEEMSYVFGKKGFRPGHIRHDNLDNVDVKPFFMQTREVSIKDYIVFLKDLGSRNPSLAQSYKPYTWIGLQPGSNVGDLSKPVTDISYAAANAYAKWLDKKTGRGYRLPSEAEWQLAASGGVEDRDYPYGRQFRSDWSITTGDSPKSCASQKYDVSPFGIYDLGGNVSEWVQTPNDLPNGQFLVKGGSFKRPAPSWARAVVKQSSRNDIGFRCVITAPEISAWKPK